MQESSSVGVRMAMFARWLLPADTDLGVWRVLAARGVRALADGYMAVLLPAYLLALGLGTVEVGVLATTTLLGSALVTIAVGAWGHRFPSGRLLRGDGVADGGHRRRLRRLRVVLAAAAGGLRRHAEPERRRRQRVPAAGARAHRRQRQRCRAHRAVRPLQRDRGAVRGDRRAGRRCARLARAPCRLAAPAGDARDVPAVRGDRRGRLVAVPPARAAGAGRRRRRRLRRWGRRGASSCGWPRCSASTRSPAA